MPLSCPQSKQLWVFVKPQNSAHRVSHIWGFPIEENHLTCLSLRAWKGELQDHHFYVAIHFYPILFHIQNWRAQEEFFNNSNSGPLSSSHHKMLLETGKMKLSSFLHAQGNTNQLNVCMTHTSLGTPSHHKILPGAERTAQAGDWAPPRLWHFYNNDWDFQRGNELSKSDSSSVWIGLPTSEVIFLKHPDQN